MKYWIIFDPCTSSIRFLNHEVHWGRVDPDYDRPFFVDPALKENVPYKRYLVYYIQMNLDTMKRDYRYASSFIWNHIYFLDDVLGGRHYELHVPIPDGMQYHLEDFEGEPYLNVAKAQEIIINTKDPEIMANLTAVGLSATNTTAQWRAVAEGTTPIAVFNYTRYQSGTVELCGILLQDYLKDIGIKLNILDAIPWDDWVVNYLESPVNHTRLCYSFGGWAPFFNDPINMIEPLFGTNETGNCFGFNNDTWNEKLLATYNSTYDSTPTREELFHEIQIEFATVHVPCFYILQLGDSISFNRDFLNERYIRDLLNPLGHLYWFNCQFTPPEQPPRWEIIIPTILVAVLTIIPTTILITRFIKSHRKS